MLEPVDEKDVKGYIVREDSTKEIRTGSNILEYLLFETEHLNRHNIQIVDFIVDLPLCEIDYYNYKDRYIKKGKFGIYVLTDNNEIIYIGSSSNIEQRIAYHEKREFALYVSMFMTKSYQDAYDLENILITELSPKLNYRVWNTIKVH